MEQKESTARLKERERERDEDKRRLRRSGGKTGMRATAFFIKEEVYEEKLRISRGRIKLRICGK